MEIVGVASVLEIVNHGTKKNGQHFQICQSAGQTRLRQNPMRCLGDIGRMHAIMVWIIVLAVAAFNGQKEILQHLGVYLVID